MGIGSHFNCCGKGPLYKSYIIDTDDDKNKETEKETDKNNININNNVINKEEKNEPENFQIKNNINIVSNNEITFKAKSSTFTRGSLVGDSNLYDNQPFKPSYFNNDIDNAQDEFNKLYEQINK